MREASRRTIAYCRVSSPAQRPDLANQRAALEQYAQTKGIAVDEWVMEIGGGLNFERKRFLRLVDAIVCPWTQRFAALANFCFQGYQQNFGFKTLPSS